MSGIKDELVPDTFYISVSATLTNSRIIATVAGGSVGIDFTGGGIGANNVIHINTSNGALGPVPTPAILPSGWQNSTVKNTTNDVRINGRQYYPASDEF